MFYALCSHHAYQCFSGSSGFFSVYMYVIKSRKYQFMSDSFLKCFVKFHKIENCNGLERSDSALSHYQCAVDILSVINETNIRALCIGTCACVREGFLWRITLPKSFGQTHHLFSQGDSTPRALSIGRASCRRSRFFTLLARSSCGTLSRTSLEFEINFCSRSAPCAHISLVCLIKVTASEMDETNLRPSSTYKLCRTKSAAFGLYLASLSSAICFRPKFAHSADETAL